MTEAIYSARYSPSGNMHIPSTSFLAADSHSVEVPAEKDPYAPLARRR